MHTILVKPVITEKMSQLTEEHNVYGFLVRKNANKIQIAKAIESKFNVSVENVRTLNHPGKTKTQFRKSGRFTGKTPSYKKAFITLKKGDKIELFDQV